MSNRTSLVLATNNPGKLSEFRVLLADLPVDLFALDEIAPELAPVVEDGATFDDNAVKKARAFAEATLMLTLADDSGLEVKALGGAPGVRSARFAGEHATDAENNAALLRALEEVSHDERLARFRCILCLVDPWAPGGAATTTVQGTCEGRIALSPKGAGGFGYDPLFLVGDGDRTIAELSDQEKNAISHRARAVQELRNRIAMLFEERVKTTERVASPGFAVSSLG